VVCDQPEWQGALGDTLRSILTEPVAGLNQREPLFDVLRVLPSGFENLVTRHRNVLQVLVDAEVEESRQSVILACGEGITLDADAEAFVVAVPAQTFAAGFTVEIVDPEGHLMRMRSDKEQVVSAGKMLAMPAVAFAPTETVAETEIRSAADMLALAENVRNGILGGSYYLAGDIDMAEVSDWKGIGVGDLNNAFNGTFDGRGFSIKNLKSAWPLFNFTLGESVIKNVTIDSSCEFANTLSPDDKISLGALVGMGRGVVEDCVNNAKVSYAGTSGFDIYVGGLVGRIYRTGRISGCVNNGDVPAEFSVRSIAAMMRGIPPKFTRIPTTVRLPTLRTSRPSASAASWAVHRTAPV
jgi:hypothetical protein